MAARAGVAGKGFAVAAPEVESPGRPDRPRHRGDRPAGDLREAASGARTASDGVLQKPPIPN
ncbi:hypothetical protein [Azospirillum halopraeferens]|uniref:hypothetical protein n=1 Tax=Azospirillum halopraeferens TaxID=34010 RepID=UPI003CCBC1BF